MSEQNAMSERAKRMSELGERVAITPPSVATSTLPPSLADLDAFVERELAGWKSPGVALAVVYKDQVIVSRGYGFRDREQALPMTGQTVCPIASVTKSMTVATLAVLARQGKLDWDRPVREYLPGFRLFDAASTDRVTPRDLVAHRTGVPRHDWVWYGTSCAVPTRESLLERLRYLQPFADMRSRWQYNNLMFVVAGYLAGQLSGDSWERTIRRLLFEPLGMNRAGTSIADMLHADEFGCGYEKDDAGEVHRSPYYDAAGPDGTDPLGPAGSVTASVDDLAKYLRMQIAGGRFEGREILTEADARAMQTPQMVMPQEGGDYPEIGPLSYGMGFRIYTYRGRKAVRHGGALDGFSINLAFLPEEGIGVASIANISGSPLPGILANYVFDRLLNLEPIDWSARNHAVEDREKAAEKSAKEQGLTTRRANTQPAHPIAEYLGQYAHPAYGVVTIAQSSDTSVKELTLGFHGFTSPLRHFHYEVWETPIDKRNRLERTKVAFDTDWNGDVSGLRIPFEAQVADIAFTRIADAVLSERSTLEAFVGTYAISSATILRIALLDDGVLQITLPGPQTYTLLPVRANVFDVKGLAGFRIEFVHEGTEAATSLALHTAEASYVAEREASIQNGA